MLRVVEDKQVFESLLSLEVARGAGLRLRLRPRFVVVGVAEEGASP
jgi:hypothetical protein